ncbi:hypothetical protein GH714_041493 [Hevea brasiliensis]|uniref:Peptidase M41 domain-containing protein n=1 Tax=Hevea brasiliensis TaxID=3981 RepID=A0A6A6MUA0_HEVBR|nr:hypothetical protein GH714_041493 [Hevea brasiliensis]
MNEAAILAGRRGKDEITLKEIDDSIDRIVAGMEGTKMTDRKSKILVAYHEIGHAIFATLTPGHDPVQKATLIPRGQAQGLTWFIPGEDPALISKQPLFARIVGGLGRRAAEEVIFGESEITTGAAGDPQQSLKLLDRGYAATNTPREAIWVFHRMRKQGIRPNNLTFPFLLKACSTCFAIKEGKQVHLDLIKHGLDCDVYVNNNLVHFYGSCKKILDACKVFDQMCVRTVVSWNAVITSCVESLWMGDAIGYFVKMMDFGFEPDETTMVLMLAVCAEMGNLSLGRWIHSQVIQRGLVLNYQLGTALVDMYAKSGAICYARLVFDRVKEKNVWTWSAMILGLAQHGFAKEGLELFLEMMTSSSIRPNYVTFLGVLCACSHAGLVDDGFQYFHEMEHRYKIKPMMVHYGAMVDILGRAGRLKEAYDFIMSMPFQPDPIVWRTLLSACNVHDVKTIME